MYTIISSILIITTVACQISKEDLSAEIGSTRQLLHLYQKKLDLLLQLYQHHFPNTPIQQTHQQYCNDNPVQINKLRDSQYLIQLKRFNQLVHYMPGSYLICNNAILKQDDYSQVAEFLGDVLQVEQDQITTLVAGKIGMIYLKTESEIVKKEEVLLGKRADKMNSLWHRNLNLKDGEDILIQWEYHKIFFRGRELRQMEFPPEQQILNIFPLNQYKVIFVTNLRIGVLNSRSQQIGQCIPAKNITLLPQFKMQIEIISATQVDNTVMVLLSSGEVARYINERIVWVQSLPRLRGELSMLIFYTSMQLLGGRLFIVDSRFKLMRIFIQQGSRLHFSLAVVLPRKGDQVADYQVFKVNDSFRLIASSQTSSSIYEILIPLPQDNNFTFNYFKIAGVIAVISVFIYFKIRKSDEEQSPKGKAFRKGDLQKGHFRYNAEVGEYLKKKRVEGVGKQKMT